MKSIRLAFSLAISTGVISYGNQAVSADHDPFSMRDLIETFQADRASLRRKYDSPMSTPASQRMESFYQQQLKTLALVDFDQLNHGGQVDYVLFRNLISHELRKLELEKQNDERVIPLLPFANQIVQLLDAKSKMQSLDAKLIAAKFDELAKRVEDLTDGLEPSEKEGDSSSQAVAVRATRRLGELRSRLVKTHEFRKGYDPLYTWWNKKPFERLDNALKAYANAIRRELVGVREDDKHPIVGEPIGREALLSELQFEMIPYEPDELIDIANVQFAWCDKEMEKASQDLGFGKDWRKTQQFVKDKHVDPGEQPKLIRELALEAERFLAERDLITVPPLCSEVWRMNMMSPERQRFSPYFLGGHTIIVSYPTDGMTHQEKMMSMRGNNIHFARATVHHELIPGHHLQQFMTKRHRPYRQVFSTPFWIEGWALYWEMLLWDLDFARSAEDRVGMLFWRKHRCARIIFSLSYHLGKMNAEQAIDFLVERVGHERKNATAEVRRSISGGYGPLYQAAYMLGGLQIRALHEELVQSGKMTDREFHDAILRENSIPIEMVRAALIRQPLEPRFQSRWRFTEVN